MKTKAWAIGLILGTTFLNSIAQILYKIGVDKFNFENLLYNPLIFFGLILYLTSGIILIVTLKYGELSVLYPIISTGFIWVSVLSLYFLKEVMNPLRWIGILLIIIGVSFVGAGSEK